MIEKRLFSFAVLVGVVSGIGALIFWATLDFCYAVFMGIAGIHLPHPGGEISLFSFHFDFHVPILFVTALGGLITGLIVLTFAPEAKGEGTNAAIRAYHYLRGKIKLRVTLTKIIASAITIGSGGSAGREGPITQIGAGFGSFIATVLGLTDKERRILLVCGIAGGLGSIFKAPLGGALFAVEVLYKKDFETQAIIPAFISSIVGYVTFISASLLLTGKYMPQVFIIPPLDFKFIHIPFYILTALLCSGISVIYILTFRRMEKFFEELKVNRYFKPLIGGALVGLMGLFLPTVLATGYGYIQETIYGNLPIYLLIISIFGKILATSLTIGSGGSGGVFGPSVVIGGFIGGVVGSFLHNYFPSITPAAFVPVGIAAFLASACKTPLAAILMTSEMTRGYTLLPAYMLVAAISYILTLRYTLYSQQLETQFDSPVHRTEMVIDILVEIKVKEAMNPNPVTVSPEYTVQEVLDLIEELGYHGYPVVENGKLVGIVTFTDLEKVPPDKRSVVKVKDVMTPNPITVSPEDTLKIALEKMLTIEKIGTLRMGRLPVVENGKLVGIITKGDIIRAYARAKRKYM